MGMGLTPASGAGGRPAGAGSADAEEGEQRAGAIGAAGTSWPFGTSPQLQ
jgi:hypothetical protein